jgi:hypothetical protein
MCTMAGAEDPEWLAVLVVRAWRRLDDATVVARITYAVDGAGRDREVVAEAGVDAIVGVVRRWLTELPGAGAGSKRRYQW